MKKIILMLAVAGILFTSCEPQIVEKIVEVDTSSTPDSLKLFMANVPQEYTEAVNKFLEVCDVVIVSYGKNVVATPNRWELTSLPENYVTIVGYNVTNGNMAANFNNYRNYTLCCEHFSVSNLGLTIGDLYNKYHSGSLYNFATPENFNTHLYGGDQYVYDIISR